MDNEKQELYNQIANFFSSLDLETSKRLKTILLNHSEEFKTNPVETITKALQEMAMPLTIEPEQEGRSRTIYDKSTREKAFVEAMSSPARQYMEGLQRQRERRYEEMIEESEEKSNSIGRR